jgi:hypothetical protein
VRENEMRLPTNNPNETLTLSYSGKLLPFESKEEESRESREKERIENPFAFNKR